MPYQPVIDSLEALANRFPSLEVQLTSAAQGDVARKLVERRADLGLLFYGGLDAGELPATGAASAVTDVHAIEYLPWQ